MLKVYTKCSQILKVSPSGGLAERRKNQRSHRVKHMRKMYLTVNSAFLFWLLALISWIFSIMFLTCLMTVLSIVGFTIYIRLNQDVSMFKNKKSAEILYTHHQDTVQLNENVSSDENCNNTTVIAKDVCFEGDVSSSGYVYIYGMLKGNIHSRDGLIKIIQGGSVSGNITCRELIVDGRMEGETISETLEISENGLVIGTISYQTLSIKKGGEFSGQAEARYKKNEEDNMTAAITDEQSISLITEEIQTFNKRQSNEAE